MQCVHCSIRSLTHSRIYIYMCNTMRKTAYTWRRIEMVCIRLIGWINKTCSTATSHHHVHSITMFYNVKYYSFLPLCKIDITIIDPVLFCIIYFTMAPYCVHCLIVPIYMNVYIYIYTCSHVACYISKPNSNKVVSDTL